MWPTYRPLGDQGVLVSFEERIDPAINVDVRVLSGAIEARGFSWLVDVLFSYRCLLVIYDPHRIRFADVVHAIREITRNLRPPPKGPSDIYDLPTVYGSEYGPDLDRVAEVTGLSPAKVIETFSSTIFTIYFLGFLCAQPYLGGLPEVLRVPRLDTPRLFVPAGSVGIGGIQAGVITIDQPSGFNYIGRTFLSLYDPGQTPPTCLRAGDRIIFSQFSVDQIDDFKGKSPRRREEEVQWKHLR